MALKMWNHAHVMTLKRFSVNNNLKIFGMREKPDVALAEKNTSDQKTFQSIFELENLVMQTQSHQTTAVVLILLLLWQSFTALKWRFYV